MVTGILGGRLNPRDNPPVSQSTMMKNRRLWPRGRLGRWPSSTAWLVEKSVENMHVFFMKWAAIPIRNICYTTCLAKKHVTLALMILKVRTVKGIPFLKGNTCVPPTSKWGERFFLPSKRILFWGACLGYKYSVKLQGIIGNPIIVCYYAWKGNNNHIDNGQKREDPWKSVVQVGLPDLLTLFLFVLVAVRGEVLGFVHWYSFQAPKATER